MKNMTFLLTNLFAEIRVYFVNKIYKYSIYIYLYIDKTTKNFVNKVSISVNTVFMRVYELKNE